MVQSIWASNPEVHFFRKALPASIADFVMVLVEKNNQQCAMKCAILHG
jgi:hypothetical protein